MRILYAINITEFILWYIIFLEDCIRAYVKTQQIIGCGNYM